MEFTIPFLSGFHIKTLGKKRLGSAQKMTSELAKLNQKNLSQLSECFHGFIPDSKLQPAENNKKRVFHEKDCQLIKIHS